MSRNLYRGYVSGGGTCIGCGGGTQTVLTVVSGVDVFMCRRCTEHLVDKREALVAALTEVLRS